MKEEKKDKDGYFIVDEVSSISKEAWEMLTKIALVDFQGRTKAHGTIKGYAEIDWGKYLDIPKLPADAEMYRIYYNEAKKKLCYEFITKEQIYETYSNTN